MANFVEKYAERYNAVADLQAPLVYGNPCAEVKAKLGEAGAEFVTPIGGFVR